MIAESIPAASWVLLQQRRGLVLWSIALAAVSAIYIGFWPAMGDGAEMQAFVENMPEGLVAALGYDQIGSPAGYLSATVFGLLAPALMLVHGITNGARTIAGDEEAGALELELSHPLARRRFLLERFGAMAVGTVVLGVVVGLVALVLTPVLEMGVGANELLAATAGLTLFVLAMATIAFAAGASSGRRTFALALGAGVAVAAFMADALAPLLDDGRWLQAASPFSWYLASEPLLHGWHAPGLLGLAAIIAVALAVASWRFDRRDLGV